MTGCKLKLKKIHKQQHTIQNELKCSQSTSAFYTTILFVVYLYAYRMSYTI